MPRIYLSYLFVLLLPAACDDSVVPTPGVYQPDWNGMQALMADHCQECHRVGGYGDYVAGVSDRGWVAPRDVRSDLQGGGGFFVIPGDADHSLLYLAITGKATYKADDGTTDVALPLMPLQTAGLQPDQIATVKEWIDNGASLDTGNP